MACLTLSCLLVAVVAKAHATPPRPTGAELPAVHDPIVLRVAANEADRSAGDLASISEAIRLAKTHLAEGRPVRLLIGPGVYRERVRIDFEPDDPAASTPLLLEGDPSGQTVISGSRVEGWQADTWSAVPDRPGVYRRDWPYRWGVHEGPWAQNFGQVLNGPVARQEMVYVGGRRLMPVVLDPYKWVDPDGKAGNIDGAGGLADHENVRGELVFQGTSVDALDALDRAWTFGVSDHPETDPSIRSSLFVRLPEGLAIEQAGPIEVGEPMGANWHRESPVVIRNKRHLLLRDLTFTHGSTFAPGSGVLLIDCRDTVIERCRFVENNATGLRFGREQPDGGCRDITILDSDFSHNGYKGMSGSLRNASIERSRFNHNNWRGVLSDFTTWDPGGVKLARSHDVLFDDCLAIGNLTNGFWFDVFCSRIVFDRCAALSNLGYGFFFELSGPNPQHGDDLATRSISAFNGGGFVVSNARRSTIDNCLVLGNTRWGLLYGQTQFRPPSTAEGYGDLTLRHTKIASVNHAPLIHVRNRLEDGGDEIVKALRHHDNRYVGRHPDTAFELPGDDRVALGAWRQALRDAGREHAETGSAWADALPDQIKHSEDFCRRLMRDFAEQHSLRELVRYAGTDWPGNVPVTPAKPDGFTGRDDRPPRR